MIMQYGSKSISIPQAAQRNAYGAVALAAGEAITSAHTVTRKPRREDPSAKQDGAPEPKKPHLLYQPQVDMFCGRIAGVEARVHWSQPGRGLASGSAPTSRLGGIAMEKAVSEWAIRKACMQASSMSQEELPAVRTTIRFSARQLMDPRLAAYIRESIDGTAIQPELIECGISESALLENHQTMAPILRKLADTGVRIAVSDFGSDRSSLSYPKQFPVNAIWIDRSFFWRFARGTGATEIVAAVLAMAAKQGLSMVACGVESPRQMMMLYREGCRVMQGNFLCRPLPLDALKTALRELGSTMQQPSHGCPQA
ncbi:MAG TPA: EAL domain-containing protein [Sulfuricella sp.]|nr:EAL domain-containing protein [Sulfuricella sp.]